MAALMHGYSLDGRSRLPKVHHPAFALSASRTMKVPYVTPESVEMQKAIRGLLVGLLPVRGMPSSRSPVREAPHSRKAESSQVRVFFIQLNGPRSFRRNWCCSEQSFIDTC